MSELTLAQPLSGEEIITSLVEKIREKLRSDCYLSGTTAYESFEADISIKVRMVDCGRIPEVAVQVHEKSENLINENDENFALEQMDIHLTAAPPNQVRQEAGLPIPTLVEGADGKRDIKAVKYARKVLDSVKEAIGPVKPSEI